MKPYLLLFFYFLFFNTSALADDYESTRSLAEQGNAEAQYDLASMYLRGELSSGQDQGRFADFQHASIWFEKAAEQGHVKSQFNIGIIKFRGLGVSMSQSEAIEWFVKAAEQGEVNAQFALAAVYSTGRGVDKNEEEAAKWYGKGLANQTSERQYGAVFLALGLNKIR